LKRREEEGEEKQNVLHICKPKERRIDLPVYSTFISIPDL